MFLVPFLLLVAGAAPAMVVVNENDVRVEEPPPHGNIGMSTAVFCNAFTFQHTDKYRRRGDGNVTDR